MRGQRPTLTLLLALFWTSSPADAEGPSSPSALPIPHAASTDDTSMPHLPRSLHPRFLLRDEQGAPVLESGQPLSQSKSCGTCHDTTFIAQHSAHARAGQTQLASSGTRSWETSTGWFGGWDPRVYDVAEAHQIELWAKTYGQKHAGGGPLQALGVELDCLLCHLENPSIEARANQLAAGNFKWASTATLLNTSLIAQDEVGLHWQSEAFPDSEFPTETLTIRRPKSELCSSCHIQSYTARAPLNTLVGESRYTGILYSGQRIDASGLNISGKSKLSRSWDVHAERLVECSDCHHSQNNPSFEWKSADRRPTHLRFDPRRSSTSAYLQRPSHELAHGTSSTHGPNETTSLRRCVSCHDPSVGHRDLPSKARHFEALACESCHIPTTHLGAISHLDWTALTETGQPLRSYRGSQGDPNNVRNLSTGYKPVLLERTGSDGNVRYAPYTLLIHSYWVCGEPERPVTKAVLSQFFSNTTSLLSTFDADNNSQISEAELRLDDKSKVQHIKKLLKTACGTNPQIRNELEPIALHHGIAEGRSVLRDCTQCHGASSRLLSTTKLADYLPGNTPPQWVRQANLRLAGDMVQSEDSTWSYRANRNNRDHGQSYVFGTDALLWLDWLGVGSLLLVLVGAGAHGIARYVSQHQRQTDQHTEEANPMATVRDEASTPLSNNEDQT